MRGVVLGDTWFWPAEDPATKIFSKVMGSWPMQSAIVQRNFFAFKPVRNLPRVRRTFPDHVLVELPDAKQYIQEDAPERITEAILDRFG